MTPEEVQLMIDQFIAKAIDKPNKTATIVSAIVGFTFLVFYAHGLIMIVEKTR